MTTNVSKPLVLLGAGASKQAGIPTAVDMTSEMLSFCVNEGKVRYAEAINALAHMLKVSANQYLGVGCADIEGVMNAAQLLANRFKLEFAPFVGAWHPIIEEIEKQSFAPWELEHISRAAAAEGMAEVGRFPDPVRLGQEMERGVQRALHGVLSRLAKHISYRPDGSHFHALSAYLKGKLMVCTWKETAKELDYFAPLIEQGRKSKITIATINYDNCIERRADDLGVPCFTGLKHPTVGEVGGWSVDGTFPEIDYGIDLIKLHGSITWLWHAPQAEALGFEKRIIHELSDDEVREMVTRIKSGSVSDEAVGAQLAVIFGGHNKLTVEGPFLDLLAKFKAKLKNHQELIVIGYSFRDPHINYNIVQWLESDRNRRMHVVDPRAPDECLFLRFVGDNTTIRQHVYHREKADEAILKLFGNAT